MGMGGTYTRTGIFMKDNGIKILGMDWGLFNTLRRVNLIKGTFRKTRRMGEVYTYIHVERFMKEISLTIRNKGKEFCIILTIQNMKGNGMTILQVDME